MNQELGITLLDKAKEVTGSDYKTAKAMGISPQRLSDWRHGRTTLQPEDMALLAGLAGMDPEAWLVRGVLAKHEGTAKGERLLSVLGKASVAIGAAIATSTAAACSELLRCIKRQAGHPEKAPERVLFFGQVAAHVAHFAVQSARGRG